MMMTRRNTGIAGILLLATLAGCATAKKEGTIRSHLPTPSSIDATVRSMPPRGGWDVVVGKRTGGAIVEVTKSRKVTAKAAVALGIALAFNAGFVNGCCLSGLAAADKTKQAVSAVTASYTNGALGLAAGNTAQFVFLTKVILSFLAGSMISGLLNPSPVPFEVASGPFAWSFGIGAILLCIAGGRLNHSAKTVESGMLLAAVANGIQNSITSTFTQNLCRSSHFTGITSDIGTFLGQVLRGNNANLFKLKVFVGLAVSFWLGGYVSWDVTKTYGSMGLYFSAALYVLIGSLYGRFADKYGKED